MLNPDLNRKNPQWALLSTSECHFKEKLIPSRGASPRRSRCHCKGLGRSASPLAPRSGQRHASLALPAALPHRQVCSARGPLRTSSPPPIPTMNTSWWRHMHVSGMLSIHILGCVFPTGTGRDLCEEQPDLTLAPAPRFCTREGAAWLPCSCAGLPSSSLTPHTMTRRVGAAPWKSEVPSRGMADVWEKTTLGKRSAKAPFTSSPAADGLLGSLWFPVPVTQQEGPCTEHSTGVSSGKRPWL